LLGARWITKHMYVTKIINQTGAELFANVDEQEDLLLSYVHLSPGFVLPSASFNPIQGLSCLSISIRLFFHPLLSI
jgi:hypothetical protein